MMDVSDLYPPTPLRQALTRAVKGECEKLQKGSLDNRVDRALEVIDLDKRVNRAEKVLGI
jgi:hypothetical protein